MKKELIKATNTELACYFIAMLALEREPISPEKIFNLGMASFIDAKRFLNQLTSFYCIFYRSSACGIYVIIS